MTRRSRTTGVERSYALARLSAAQAYLQQAVLSRELVEGPFGHSTVVSAATIAGIAAADAACGHALGLVNASGNHSDAVDLLRTVRGGGPPAKALGNLLGKKSESQYTAQPTSESAAKRALRHAEVVVEFAQTVTRT
jgi:uncharacterized protein (DUF1810 family)